MPLRSTAFALAALLASALAAPASTVDLPQRETPVPRTTNGVPHIQLGIKADPDLSEKLLGQVGTFPGVTLGPPRVSLSGAVGFQLADGLPLARPEVIVGGREFAHLHPDGSLHASLEPALAKAAVQTGWAVAHPWATQRDGWEGFVLIFTPTNEAELEVVLSLVENSYSFVTGQAPRP